MEALILAIYSFFVWLIFIKFNWLPWNTRSQVTVVIIPIVGLTATILLLNIYAPSSTDVRVIASTVQIVPQVRGRVIEVSAEGSANDLREQLRVAAGSTAALRSRIELAQRRVRQFSELTETGAGNRFDLEKAQADLKDLEGQAASALASEARVRAQLAAVVDGDLASVAKLKADLAKARWELSQTVMYAPADGTAINVQLRPGAFVVGIPLAPAMTFVEDNYTVVALFNQNELHKVEPGNEAEVALFTYPGRVIKASVDSIVWAQGQGQLVVSGVIPDTGVVTPPPNRFAVKLTIAERDRDLFLAAGARGDAAIYTSGFAPLHVIRKVILRVGSYTNYLILKLH